MATIVLPGESGGAVCHGEAIDAPFSLSVLTVTKGHASKQLLVGAHGQPIKGQGSLAIAAGMLEHVQVAGLAGLQALLRAIHPNQALVHGVVKGSRPGDVAPLVTTEALKQAKPGTLAPGTVARSLEYVAHPDDLFLLMFDRDDNVEDPTQLTTADDLLTLLAPILPGIAAAGAVVTNSTSSAIRAKKTREWLVPTRGFHIYHLARGNLARFVDLLTVRLWNAGYGYCKMATPNAQTGVAAVLTRAVVDLAVFSPERLDYVAGARISKSAPFYQDRGEPRLIDGDLFDLDALPEVTTDERREYAERLTAAKAALAPARFQQVQAVIAAADPALPAAQVEVLAQERLQQQESCCLPEDFLLYFFHRKTAVQVQDLSADYDGLRLADPAEPSYRDGTDAVLHWRQGHWVINSFAHGLLTTYRAVPQPPPDPDDDDMQDLLQRAEADASRGRNGHAPCWHKHLLPTKDGEPRETFNNLAICLEQLDPWRTDCWYDVVRERAMVGTAPLNDDHIRHAARVIEAQTRLPIRNLRLVASAVRGQCAAQHCDLLQDWLASIPAWDGTRRLLYWLQAYAGAPINAYTAEVSRLWPVSMVARALVPGCQCRSVPILEGPEELGKSRLVETVAGAEWYRDISGSLEGKEAHMILKGAWVVELSELAVMGKTQEARLKAFITMANDEYVPKYANDPVKQARRTILVGTVNPEGDRAYLSGQTGNTRFYPVPVTTIDLQAVALCREQLFAEALAYYNAHRADWWQLSREAATVAAEERELRRQRGIYEDSLANWIDKQGHTEVWWEMLAEEFLALPLERWSDRRTQLEISKSLAGLGWVKQQQRRLSYRGASIRARPWTKAKCHNLSQPL